MAANPRQVAHELIEQMPERYVAALVALLEATLDRASDPASRAIANAPVDDEPESEGERAAVAASKAWMAENPGQGISGYELLMELGMKETA